MAPKVESVLLYGRKMHFKMPLSPLADPFVVRAVAGRWLLLLPLDAALVHLQLLPEVFLSMLHGIRQLFINWGQGEDFPGERFRIHLL